MSEAFSCIVAIGERLAVLHIGYDNAPEYALEWQWTPGVERSWYVASMHFNADKSAIVMNQSLTLAGIPAAAHEHRLGNRSALEWVLDQYRVSTDKRTGFISDPNREDDPEYIARLVCRICYVSVETVRLQRELETRFPIEEFGGMGVMEVNLWA